jgi:excisionase family DNA binding protein
VIMAGMFYSLREAAEKLGVTEERLREFVNAGRLREFRDGPNVLFKVDEIEALMGGTGIRASKEISDESQQPAEEQEITLTPEPTEDIAAGSELTDADTAIASEGINVLGETDGGYKLTDDTMAETKAVSEAASLEEIEEDVNLDTFGSGSGLLDLSLQADDTSLGGILDEIYTPEGGENQQAGEAGSAMEVAAEAEEILPEEFAAPQPAMEAPLTMAQAYVEPEPDMISNAFGIMLFLPLLAIVYTAIVVVGGFNNVTPSILGKIQGMIWYIMAGTAVAAVAIVGVAFMSAGRGSVKKVKAAKEPKAKKVKKAQ